MALTVTAPILPNVRKTIVPDPGMLIIDCDLSGADAQVVAWEAGDEELKSAFKAGLKIHVKNAADMLGPEWDAILLREREWQRISNSNQHSPEFDRTYASMKSFVHGVNYGESDRTLAITQGWSIYLATQRKAKWFKLHPAIPAWHRRVEYNLSTHHKVVNPFGFHMVYFDRADAVFTQALAWVPQSTVGNSCTRGILQVRERLPWVEPLIQVHDSGVFQFPKSRQSELLLIRDALRNEIPYRDPLVIPWGVAISDRSWGDCQKMSWEEAATFRF